VIDDGKYEIWAMPLETNLCLAWSSSLPLVAFAFFAAFHNGHLASGGPAPATRRSDDRPDAVWYGENPFHIAAVPQSPDCH
jgi:hypothetical protein